MSLPQYEEQKEFKLPPPAPPYDLPPERHGNPWLILISLLVGIGLLIGRYYLPHQQRFSIYGNPPIRIDHEGGQTWRLENGIWTTIEDDTEAQFAKSQAKWKEFERREEEVAKREEVKKILSGEIH